MKNLLHVVEHVASARMIFKRVVHPFHRKSISVCVMVVLAGVQLAFSQSGPPAAQDANQLKYIDILPPSPAVSSLANFNRPDVGMYSGSAKFSIPLGSIDLPGLSIPIGLNYSTNGVKVDELSSRVGIGWQIEAGGSITRTVRGSGADEKSTNLEPPANTSTSNQQFVDYLTSALVGSVDTEPDIFNFSFCGVSGSFILNGNDKPVQLNKSNLKIEFVPTSTWDFKITDDKGNEFYFGGDNYLEQSKKEQVCAKEYTSFEVTAWFLQKIILFNGEEINFNYITVPEYVYDLGVNQTLYYATPQQIGEAGACPCPQFPVINTCTNLTRVKTKALYTIVSRGKSLYLGYKSRTDCGDYLVEEIDIHFGGNHDKYRLSYKNFNTNSYLPTGVTIIGNNQNRPFLDMIYRIGSDGIWNRYYAFVYNNPGALPVRLSFAQDHWGYFNGKNNTSLVPLPIASYQDEFPGATANREIDTLYSKTGVLTKIYYPTGGYDSMEYESNRTPAGIAGGVRVKRIKSYSKPGSIVQTKRYRYATIAAPSASTGVARYSINYLKSINFDYTCPSKVLSKICSYMTMSSSSFTNLFSTSGSSVSYSTVVEYLEGSDSNGATEHTFAVGMDSQGELLVGQQVNGGTSSNFSVFYGGKELKTTYYRKNSTAYEMVNRVTNFYSEQDSLFNQYYGVIITKTHSDPNILYCAEATRYIVFSPWVTLDSTREETFANGQVLTKVTKLTYTDTKSLKPTLTTTKDNFDRTEAVYSYYPSMRSQIPGLATGQNTYLGALVSKNNIGQVVYEKRTLNGSFNGLYELLYGSFNSKILPAEVKLYYQEGLLGGGFQIMGYDSYGNITQRKSNDGIITSYLWGYASVYPIAEFRNAVATSVAATSFESAETGNWTIASGTVVDTQLPPTGKQCLQLGTIQKTLLPGEIYILSYWYKGGTVTVTGATVNSQTSQTGPDGWTNVVAQITSNTTLYLSGSGYIDDVRLYPSNALASTYTYHPIQGLQTMSDANNQVQYYDYDVMGRLSLIRDSKKNIVKQFKYHLNEPTPQSGYLID